MRNYMILAQQKAEAASSKKASKENNKRQGEGEDRVSNPKSDGRGRRDRGGRGQGRGGRGENRSHGGNRGQSDMNGDTYAESGPHSRCTRHENANHKGKDCVLNSRSQNFLPDARRGGGRG